MDLKEALKIVHDNGYYTIKTTKKQEEDMDICEKHCGEGDCLECSCNICLMLEL